MNVRDLAIMCYEAVRALPENRNVMPEWSRVVTQPVDYRAHWDEKVRRAAKVPLPEDKAENKVINSLAGLFKDGLED